MGRTAGLSDDELTAIAQRNDAVFPRREQLALRLAAELTATPANVANDFFAELIQEFTEEELIELAAHIAFENNRARFNRVFDVGSDSLYCALPPPKK